MTKGATPPSVTPDLADWQGFCLKIPDTQEWRGLVLGVLLQLSYGYYWDKTNPDWQTAKKAGQNICLNYMQHNPCTEDVCTLILQALANGNGTVQEFLIQLLIESNTACDSATYATILAGINALTYPILGTTAHDSETVSATYDPVTQIIDFGIVKGLKGDTGETGTPGLDGTDAEPCVPCVDGAVGPAGPAGSNGTDGTGIPGISAPTTNATNNTAELVACGVTEWTLIEMNSRFEDALQIIQDGIDIAEPMARIATNLINMAAQFTLIGDEALSAATELVLGQTQQLLDAVKTAYDTDFKDHIRCSLYCLLKPRGGDYGTTFADVLSPWTDEMILHQPVAIAPFYSLFIHLFDVNYFKKLAQIGSNNPGECDDCTDCPEENSGTWTYARDWTSNIGVGHWQFTSNAGWFPDFEGGYWGSGNGYRLVAGFLQWADNELRIVDSIDVTFRTASFSSLNVNGRRPGFGNSFDVNDTTIAVGSNGQFTVHIVCGGDPVAYLAVNVVGAGGGAGILQKVTINGSGGTLPTALA